MSFTHTPPDQPVGEPAHGTVAASSTDEAGSVPASRQRESASQWRLIWWRFRQHKLAMVGASLTVFVYLVALFAEFLAPVGNSTFNETYTYAPPQQVHVWDSSGDGMGLGLYVHPHARERHPDTLAQTFTPDESEKIEVGFFVEGEEYKLFGLIPWDRHLIGPKEPGQPFYLLGADSRGRDVLSRMIHGTRVSMTIGLVGVAMVLVLGVTLGGISGYVGGKADTFIQRLVEFFMSLPTLPLWIGLAAALPRDWGPLQRYFAITVILAMIAWTGMCRTVRGRFLALRNEEFVTAALLDGNSHRRVIFRHMLPSFTSHLIAVVTLSIPRMILAETALSFLGLGLQAPVVSWGVLMQEAQEVRVLADAPWLLLPGLCVIITILAMNFAGDGLRDAADPYKN